LEDPIGFSSLPIGLDLTDDEAERVVECDPTLGRNARWNVLRLLGGSDTHDHDNDEDKTYGQFIFHVCLPYVIAPHNGPVIYCPLFASSL
jgi:hypothetical protein